MSSPEGYKNIILHLINSADEKLVQAGLRILTSLLGEDYRIDEGFKDCLLRLSQSRNYEIRKFSTDILLVMFPEVQVPPIGKKDLNKVFDLLFVTSENVGTHDDLELSPLDTVRDTINPEEFVQPFAYWIGILSDQCEIPEINLAFRTYQIARELESPDKVTGQYELKLKKHLNAIDIGYPMVRPRHRLIQTALLHLLTELIDSGILNESDSIVKQFLFYDPDIPFISPVVRPEYVKSLLRDGKSNYRLNAAWVSVIDASEIVQPTKLENGKYVMAEYTLNRNHGWGLPTEIFMRHLIAEGTRLQEVDDYIFAKLPHCKISDYPNNYIVHTPHLIVTNHFFAGSGDSDKYHWLAINPSFAQMMRWKPALDGLFRWLDNEGNLMVESVYWMDGNIWEEPPHYESTTGVGWIVLATAKAMKQIKLTNLVLLWESRIIRTTTEEKQYYKEVRTFLDPFQ